MNDELIKHDEAAAYAQFETDGTRKLDQSLMTKSWDANFFIWQRNLQGGQYGLNEVIRQLAERRNGPGKPFRILEYTQGVPLKTIELTGQTFRRYGDMLETGDNIGSHPVPQFETTVVSPADYLLKFLQGDVVDTDDHIFDMLQLVIYAFDRNFPNFLPKDISTVREIALNIYKSNQKYGRANFAEADNKTPQLVMQNFAEQKKQFDLIFLDTEGITDLQTFFLTVQKTLAEGGIAYAPISWWSPKWGGGVTKIEILENDVVQKLVASDPKHFAISEFPGAPTLIIKGSEVAAHEGTEQQVNDSSTVEFYGTLEQLQSVRKSREAEKLDYEQKIADTKARIIELEKLRETDSSVQIISDLIHARSDLESYQYFLDTAIRSLAILAQKRPVW